MAIFKQTITKNLGARLFLIASQGSNLFAQTLGTAYIAPCQGNGKGKFEFFQGVLSLLGRQFRVRPSGETT